MNNLIIDLAKLLEVSPSPGHSVDIIITLLESKGYRFDRSTGTLGIWLALLAKKWHDRYPNNYYEQAKRIIIRIEECSK